MQTENKYKHSPWGAVQDCEQLADGIYNVSTASHGGIKLDRERNSRMPEDWRQPGGWYEEDCDWCLPFIVFQADILNGGEKYAVKHILEGLHIKTLKNWHPDKFEQYFDTILKPGESYLKDNKELKAKLESIKNRG
jgi:hypothetical protein